MIHVVTAVHNRLRITEKFVESLKRQTYGNIHLLLIDDGSDDGTDEMIRTQLPGSTILYGDGSLWWAGALHKAWQWICLNAEDIDAVLITNDDTEYPEDYIAAGIAQVKENPNTLIAGCGYGKQSGILLDGAFEHSFIDGTGKLLEPDSTGNCASTRSLFLTAGMWKRIGGMHPRLLPHYFSDFEFTIRAHRLGMEIKNPGVLKFCFDEGATGDNRYENLTVTKMFGKRSGCNPIYRISFILLSTPLPYIPVHLYHQLVRYLKKAGYFIHIVKRRK
ncbi:MAG: glycosyltransferase family 2 protein [Lachnospiraceae bacterium]|jgi:GT2 family glycosyltransferase|nr:glycosyltransferase family 2 protein [Lachnospiraceae bacterium]